MAISKAKTKAKVKAKAKRKSPSRRKPAVGSDRGRILGKYVDDLRIGGYSWEDVLNSSHKNMSAIADANRAVLDGYTDIAKHQYEMLKGLLRELRKVRGDRDVVVKELKVLIERAKKDVQKLQKEAARTNSKAQKIVKKRADANLKTWKKLTAEVKKSVGGKRPAAKKSTAKKKAAPRKKAAAKKKAAPKRKAATRKKAASKKKSPARKKPAKK